MAKQEQRRWNRDETLAVLSLYCQIPFGRMHSKNPAVGELARKLDRTPSAIALKLVNFASLDPEHRTRGVSGMRNVSALDREVWAASFGNWAALSEATPTREPIPTAGVAETEALVLQRVRRGQAFFRRTVLAAYEEQCCITGIACADLLRASHIMPWSRHEERRLDPRNGLSLNALHDAAFDRGLMTFDEECRVVLSKNLIELMPRTAFETHFERYVGEKLRLPSRFAPAAECLAYHRETIFRN